MGTRDRSESVSSLTSDIELVRSTHALRRVLPHGFRSAVTRKRFAGLVLLMLGGCTVDGRTDGWIGAFGYAEASLHQIEIRDFGFPHIPVGIGGDTIWLPFDTGNMVGLTLESRLFHGLDLPCSAESVRRDSGGRQVFAGCIAHDVRASVLGRVLDSTSIYEFSHERLPGLLGPGTIPGTRFTLDYSGHTLAVDSGTSEAIPGFTSLRLVKSPAHPRLILIQGRVRGHDVLIELDTGKSRTTVDAELVESLTLERTSTGADVGLVEFGPRSATVSSARVVQTAGISEGLPLPISLGIGSDILSGFLFTVDYASGQIWIEDPREPAS